MSRLRGRRRRQPGAERALGAMAAALLLLAPAPTASCDAATTSAARSDAGRPPDADEPSARAVVEAGSGEVPVRLEVANSPSERERGLMHRRELPGGRGMIFVFPRRRDHHFWMKNTPIPLDMIFLDGPRGAEEAEVVGVIREAAPNTERLRSIGRPSRWVVEVPGGWAAEHGVSTGARVRLEDVPPPADGE